MLHYEILHWDDPKTAFAMTSQDFDDAIKDVADGQNAAGWQTIPIKIGIYTLKAWGGQADTFTVDFINRHGQDRRIIVSSAGRILIEKSGWPVSWPLPTF